MDSSYYVIEENCAINSWHLGISYSNATRNTVAVAAYNDTGCQSSDITNLTVIFSIMYCN